MPILPALLSLVKWKQLNESQRWFCGLLWFIIVVSFTGRWWALVVMKNNLPFFYIYILGEFLFFLQIFRLWFGQSIKDRVWIRLGVLFSIVWTINVFTGEGWWAFPDYIRALESILLITIVIIWFQKMLREKVILHPYKTFEFWISAGLLIFLSGNFLLFVFSKLILNAGKEVFLAIWKVNAILNILLYGMYTIALVWVKRTIK